MIKLEFYTLAREGIWPLHNNIRGPIMFETSEYDYSYPRKYHTNMTVLHDGGAWILVKYAGSEEYVEFYFYKEPLTDYSLGGLLQKIYAQAEESDSSHRTTLCKQVKEYLSQYVTEDKILNFDQDTENFLQNDVFNKYLELKHPTYEEIIERNLLP